MYLCMYVCIYIYMYIIYIYIHTHTYIDGAQAFAEEHGINTSALKSTLLAMLVFFKGAARKHLTHDLVKQDMERFGTYYVCMYVCMCITFDT
jgi:hypothetical protein